MIITPSIRSNIFTNSHPLGCQEFVLSQIREVKQQPQFVGPKNVLILGGSSGYGLASRIALAFGANANTINVSFESAPKGKRSGTAGWWNNIYFQEAAKETGRIHKDFVGDAFAQAMREDVIAYLLQKNIKVDLVIYSLAAGARKDDKTGETVRSHIKTIGGASIGKTIDVSKKMIEPLVVEDANQTEIDETVYVMGGSAWKDWIDELDHHNLLAKHVKTISYTYIGGPTTAKIYRNGTLGKAKEDLENTARNMHDYLADKYQGEALISSSKAVVTKASVFIPQMPIYVSCLYDVMMRHNVHESIVMHKFRLFNDMVYGNNRILDNKGRIRLDHLEMQEPIQTETVKLMSSLSDEELFKLDGTNAFFKEFYQIHGFDFDTIDYETPVDLSILAKRQPE